MARGFRVWVEPDPTTGQPTARAARLSADPDRFDPRVPWAQPEGDPEWPEGAPWGLLLEFLNLERRVPPYDWPRHQHVSGWAADWEDWKGFQRATGAPYLLAEDQGHPLLWFPATDGEMWGVLFNFGFQSGQWHWWVPGTQRLGRDPATGSTLMILGETHPEGPDGKTIRELLAAAPDGRFEVDSTQFLTLPEAVDGELRRHPADERNRCRFRVYPAAAHVHALPEPPEYGLQTLEAQREALASVAWTCLSPHPALWDPMACYDWRVELGGRAVPDPDDAATERRLAALPAAERFARLPTRGFWGATQQGFAFEGNPLAPLLERLTPDPRVTPTTAPRVLPNMQRRATAGALDADAPAPTTEREAKLGSRARQEQVQAARRRLGRALAVGEAFTTTDLFAAVAQQVLWAVQGAVTIRACGHPQCGRAFVPETGRHRYCPEHRGGTARSQRSRAPRPGIAPWEG